jgi:threonine dehydratase
VVDIHKQVLEAHRRIKDSVVHTPLERSNILSERSGANVYLKCEHLQHTGSFKLRGAFNKLMHLHETADGKKFNIVAASTGNHGMAVAYAANKLGIDASIYLPRETSQVKQCAIRSLGAKIVPVDGDCLQAEIEARKRSEETGASFVSPYNDDYVVAGQGTLGVELAEDAKLDAVFISVGGGGLIGGIGSYLKSVNPKVRIVGCWPENAPAMLRCIEAKCIVDVPEQPTLSNSTAGGVEPGSVTFEVCRNVIDEHLTVTETEIADAMRLIAEHERWLVEGAAGVAVAALIKSQKQYAGKNVAIVLCGRNLSLSQIERVFGAPASSRQT